MSNNSNNISKWPYFAEDEIEASSRVLASGKVNYWTGNECKEFEKEFAEYVGVPHAMALANGTVALELALKILDIGVGDEVIVPCRTFIASASCVVAMGAKPIMADIDRVSQNITVESIARALTSKTKAIIPVHLAGWPCEMDAIMDFAQQHNLKVIEDCAQSHGAKYKGRVVGSFGDLAAFSFCQDKIMTTGGEGGMLMAKDETLWKRAWAYKDHGKGYDVVFNNVKSTGFRWLHESFGSNFRMTEMQAAIGREQLKKLSGWLDQRKRNAHVYNDFFANIAAVRMTIPPEDVEHAYYKYYVFLKPEQLRTGWNRDKLIQAINDADVPCFSGSCSEIYLEKAFVNAGLQPKQRLANAKELGETSLMFLVHPTLKEADIAGMCFKIEKVFKEAMI